MAGFLNNLFNKGTGGQGGSTSEAAIAFKEKGKDFYFNKNYENAIEELNKALRTEPDYVDALVLKGECLMNLGRCKESITVLQKVLTLDPYNYEGWLNMAFSEDKLGNYANAVQDYEVYLLFAPVAHAKVIFYTMQRLHALGIADIAADIIRLEINTKNLPKVQKQLASQNVTVLAGKGMCLLFLGKLEQSVLMYDKAIQNDPNVSSSWVGKSLPLQQLGRHDQAIQVLDHALQLDPQNSQAWYQKGKCLKTMGQLNDALHCYDQQLIYESDDEFIYSGLMGKAEIEDQLGLVNEAIASYKKSLEIPLLYPEAKDQARKRLQELMDQQK